MSLSSEQQLSQLKALKVEKGTISGKFKHLQKDTPEYTQQLALMKQISQHINQLEAAIKDTSLNTDAPHEAPATAPTVAPAFASLDEQRCWGNHYQLAV